MAANESPTSRKGAWRLVSHKVCRWLVPPALVLGTLVVIALAFVDARALPFAAAAGVVVVLAAAGWLWPEDRQPPSVSGPCQAAVQQPVSQPLAHWPLSQHVQQLHPSILVSF